MDVEWDREKSAANLRKHGIDFHEAAAALLDPSAMAQEDHASAGEQRWVLLGLSEKARLLVVVYTLRGEDRVRLISARRAARKEAEHYA